MICVIGVLGAGLIFAGVVIMFPVFMSNMPIPSVRWGIRQATTGALMVVLGANLVMLSVVLG